MPSRRALAVTTIVTAAAFLFTGCASANDQAGGDAEATTEGAITLYSGRDEELVQPLIDMFEETHGIDVEVRYGDTAELSALLMEEGDKTPADVFLSQDAGALGALAEAGLLTQLPEETTGQVLADFTSTDDTWVGVTGRARVIVYDGEKLSADEVPDTVDAFTQPEWRGRLGIAPGNASFQAFVTAYRALNGEKKADEWVSAIAGNQPQLFESNGAILTAVNTGVVEIGLINHYYWFRLAAENGTANMRAKLAFPKSGDAGSIVNVTGAGILNPAEGDADAATFVNFLLSPEAQQYFVSETFEYPLVPGVDAPEGLPALSTLVNPDLDLADLKSLQTTQDLLRKYSLI